ncbi:hypothetical protein BaRGS_00009347 [Batillaria attramentaria]|uniref:Uncharacterized protein n=1 Tax=Batillaria attramentaria TaxID=370345 RepID=A0ABD0LJ65_9CAEN
MISISSLQPGVDGLRALLGKDANKGSLSTVTARQSTLKGLLGRRQWTKSGGSLLLDQPGVTDGRLTRPATRC